MIPYITPNKRLSQSDYIRPEKTITESIQNKKSIEEQLQNYEEITTDDDLNFTNIGTHLKYLSYDKKNNREMYRFGGILKKVSKDYIILSGKDALTFSVQRYTRNDKNEIIHTTRFFKKINKTELIENKYQTLQEESLEALDKQASIISKQKKEIMELKKKLSIKK